MTETRSMLLQAAADVVREQGVPAASARVIAARAGVNQALVFYHFGSVNQLIEAACRQAVDESVARYRTAFAATRSLPALLEVGRALHERERALGNVAMMAQLMASAPSDPVLARAARYAIDTWTADVSEVVARLLADSPISDVVDAGSLARAVSASFIGLELYDGVDPEGARRALDALERLAVLVDVVNDLGPVARRALRARIRGRGAGQTRLR